MGQIGPGRATIMLVERGSNRNRLPGVKQSVAPGSASGSDETLALLDVTSYMCNLRQAAIVRVTSTPTPELNE